MRVLLLALVALAAPGCLGSANWQAPVKPPMGAIFTLSKVPMQVDFHGVPLGPRTGTATAYHLRAAYLFGDALDRRISLSWGDASIATAARQGGITKINYVDYQALTVLLFFVRLRVEVNGE